MIEYIRHNQNITQIYQQHNIEIHDKPCMSIIKNLCLEHLITYEGYTKSVQLKYGKVHLIPLVLSNELMLIPTMRVRNYDNIWVNLTSIKSINQSHNGIIITFFSHRTLEINKPMHYFKSAIAFCHLIKNEKVKHFHT